MGLEDLIAQIEDTLGDLTIVNPVCGWVTHDRNMLPSGYYIQYLVSSKDRYRAVYLGDGVKVGEMKRNFDKWAMNWRV